MTYGFQILALLPGNRRVSGEAPITWTLPQPVGTVQIVASGGAANLDDSSELTIYGSGFESENVAKISGETLISWLRVTSALGVLGFDIGGERQLSWFAPEVEAAWEAAPENEGRFLTPDFHGLITFEERGRPTRMSLRGTFTVTQSANRVHEDLQRIAAAVTSLPVGVAVACDLLSVSEHLLTDEAKFLTYVYAMEALVERTNRSVEGVAWIDNAIANLKNTEVWSEPKDRDAIIGAIGQLKLRSIRWSLRDLAMRTRPDDSSVAALVDDAYSLRGDLVHPDRARRSVDQLMPLILALIQDEIRFLLNLGAAEG